MRRLLPLLLLLLTSVCDAQNWALLNPAYRYNYSDDGTDTISNQIRVMGVDTLGVDSVRYTLNLIGLVCDTCPASLGADCDGCFVWVDQPQFLGFDCIRVGNDWHFNGTDTLLLRMDAQVGDTWLWSLNNTTTATMDAEWVQEEFGIIDTVRRITLSTEDTILISRSFGILSIQDVYTTYHLIGIEGAEVGVRFPDPISYFDYNIGDELTYSINSVYWANPPGGPVYPVSCQYSWMVRILGREDLNNVVIYNTSVAYTSGNLACYGALAQEPIWSMPQSTWTFDRNTILSDHPILDAYPGQIMDTSICFFAESEGFEAKYLIKSEISPEGHTRMRSEIIGLAINGPSGGINAADPVLPGLIPFVSQPLIDVHYEEKIGIINVESVYDQFIGDSDIGVRVRLVGAIIDGDTIIAPPAIDWTVSINEASPVEVLIHPNPASNTCIINGLRGPAQAFVFDLEGRTVQSAQLTENPSAMDVSGLAPGTYIMTMEGIRPQRLIIAR